MCNYIIRTARLEDAPGLARVHVDTWRTTYRGIVPDEHLDSLSCESGTARRAARLAVPGAGTFCLVAQAQHGAIVGFADAGPERGDVEGFDGEVYAMYVLQPWQGRGIGRALMAGCARRLLEQGMTGACARVLAANRACGFYGKLGGAPVAAGVIEIGGKELETVTYGWPDLGPLISPGEPDAG